MTQIPHPLRPRAALLIGAAFLATPALAQEAPAGQSVAPPPILVSPAPAPVPPPVIRVQPAQPIVQAIPATPEPQAEPAPRAARAEPRATPVRPTRAAATPARAEAAAPVAEPQPAPAPAPVAAAPEPAPVAAPEPAPVTDTVTETTTTETAARTAASPLPWAIGAVLLILAAIAAFALMRRRRSDTVADEPYVEAERREPVYVPQSVPAADPVGTPEYAPFVAAAPTPVAPIEAPVGDDRLELAEADREDLVGVVDAPAPVAHRPWLELGIRPVRAGTNEDEAIVDLELTVGNAGDTPARDVRIATFLLADAEQSEMESLLIDHPRDAAVPPVTIAPGDGTRVDAHLAVPKGELGRTFNPVVVAEARYTLPDGREGRTAAAFRIGRPGAEGIGPIGATRPHIVDEVEAELFGAPEHA